MSRYQLHLGDCLSTLKTLPDHSVDSVVSDPPYGLSFMSKKWDYDVPPTEVWAECLRVLKPGGHLLAFAGTRTQHRMAVRIEDAGFEIRDMLAWAYGSGFPKSCDASEAMRRRLAGEVPALSGPANINPDVYKITAFLRDARDKAGWTNKRIDALFGTNGMAGHWVSAGSQPACPSLEQWETLKMCLGFGDDMDALVTEFAATERPDDWGQGDGDTGPFLDTLRGRKDLGATQSWGTALKPALEPVTLARKPLAVTVAHTVLAYGTGALHIDGCRVEGKRWPANLMHDGEEAADHFGDASRFFYAAKASKADREDGNNHPTVKPTELMRYLCRLVTPPGGVVLDPYMGSGSTGKAAMMEGFRFIGCELNPEYLAIAKGRISKAADEPDESWLD